MKDALPKTLVCSAILLALTTVLTGCSDSEAEARKMQNLAITAEKEGRGDDARRIYEELVAKYPQTQSAVDANKRLLASAKAEEATDKIKQAFGSTINPKTARKQIEDLSSALDIYRLELGRYPSTEDGLSALVRNTAKKPNWNGPYIKVNQVPKDPWGHDYQYRSPGQHGSFDLWSFGADGREGGEGENQDILGWE